MSKLIQQKQPFPLRSIPSLVVVVLFSIFRVTYSSATYNITNANELIAFSKSVNDGTTFSGTTVILTEDIGFSSSNISEFEPIGKGNSIKGFASVFDGQGHIIKNLVMNSSDFKFAGLFGYSVGLTIRNVVIDETCSFSSFLLQGGSSDVFVSSTIGCCEASSGKSCIIENVVNMAKIAYKGEGRTYVIAGGIAAKCTGKCILNNCVNFGSVLTSSNEASYYIFLGGIVGEIGDSSGSLMTINNCLNYGTVTNDMNGTSSISVGGIAGIIWSNLVIENCLSAGPVSSSVGSDVLYLGAIIGSRKIDMPTCINNTIRNSFWTESVGGWNASGEVIENVTLLNVTGTSLIEMNESSINTLYNIMEASGESSFAIAHLNGGRIGNSTSDTLMFHRSHIPAPAKEGHSFVSWCTDSDCSELCYGNSSNPCNSKDIYALWAANSYTITFLTFDDNNSAITKYLEFGQPIEFPENLVKEGHSFIGWDNTTSTVPARDITISAIWTINNYTLTFDFDNGTVAEVRTIKFNDPINYPEDPKKEGYRFIGWDNNITNMPARDFIIYALWTANSYTITFLTFDDNNSITKYLEFGQPIEFPENLVKEGHSFIGWDNTTSTVPARDITISAIWIINNYTLAFDFGNGTVAEVRTIKFNDSIEYPENPQKEGYKFIGWNSNSVMNMPASDLTIKALWEYVGSPTNFVNITFGTADLSEDTIKAVIKEYVSPSAEFEIIRVSEGNGETVVIVKFVDANEAKSFVETISEPGEKDRHNVKAVGFDDDEVLSLSLCCVPSLLLYLAFLMR